jgi:hypothetical protein
MWHIRHEQFRPHNFPFFYTEYTAWNSHATAIFPVIRLHYIKSVSIKEHTDVRFSTAYSKHNHSHNGLFGHQTTGNFPKDNQCRSHSTSLTLVLWLQKCSCTIIGQRAAMSGNNRNIHGGRIILFCVISTHAWYSKMWLYVTSIQWVNSLK